MAERARARAENAERSARQTPESQAVAEGTTGYWTVSMLIAQGESSAGVPRVSRDEFLAALRTDLEGMVDQELGSRGWTGQDCPWIDWYVERYRRLPLAQWQNLADRWLPPGRRHDANELRRAVVERARRGVVAWRHRGESPLLPLTVGEEATAPHVLRWALPGAGPVDRDAARVTAALGPGEPLPSSVARRFGSELGADASRVRLHRDSRAASVASSLQARAFAVGEHVAFGAGEYRPGTPEGDAILAHELAHAAQQRNAGPGATTSESAAETDADRVAAASMARLAGRNDLAAAVGGAATGVRSGLALRRCSMEHDPSSQVPPQRSQSLLVETTPAASPNLPAASARTADRAGASELQAQLRLIDRRLERLASDRSSDAALQAAVTTARATAEQMREGATGDAAESQRVRTAVDIAERLAPVFSMLDAQAQQYEESADHLQVIEGVRARYVQAVSRMFEDDAETVFNAAEAAAARVPRALVDVNLDRMATHAASNREYLVHSVVLENWVTDMRQRLDAFEQAARERTATPESLAREGELLQLGLEGMEYFDQRLRAFEYMISNRPGILDTPTVDAMNRLRDRVEAVKRAFDDGNLDELRSRVVSLRNDEHVARFYRALPGMMGTTRLIAQVGVAFVAAAATGGVAGLVTGGARATATGLTVRGALSFAGTVALEAITFTAVSTTLNAALFGQPVSFGSVLRDLAWNAGLFTVLRFARAGTSRALRAADLEVLTMPVNLVTPFPILQSYGILRFRVERERWPNREELNRMTAENVIVMTALAVGLRSVQRWVAARQRSRMGQFRATYGLEFDALHNQRRVLENQLAELERRNAPADEIEAARENVARLEARYQDLIRRVLADRSFTVEQLRAELDAARAALPDAGAEVLADTLGIPSEVGLRSVGARSHTYASGRTTTLMEALRNAGATVTRTQDSATSLRLIEARFGGEPPITFIERPAHEIVIDPAQLEVQRLFTDLSVTRPEAQRMMLRLMTEALVREPSRDVPWAVRQTRRQIRDLLRRPGAPDNAQDLLLQVRRTGVLRATADARLNTEVDALRRAGILESPEWMDSRDSAQFEGVVTEWLARRRVATPAGGRVLRRVTFIGDAFTDAAGTSPFVRSSGRPLTDTTLVELDYVSVVERGQMLEVHAVANVKAARAAAAEAAAQNLNALGLIRSVPGRLPVIQIDGRPAYVRVNRVTALEGGTEIDITGRLEEGASIAREQTIGPRGGRGYTDVVPFSRADIRNLAQLLIEQQLIASEAY